MSLDVPSDELLVYLPSAAEPMDVALGEQEKERLPSMLREQSSDALQLEATQDEAPRRVQRRPPRRRRGVIIDEKMTLDQRTMKAEMVCSSATTSLASPHGRHMQERYKDGPIFDEEVKRQLMELPLYYREKLMPGSRAYSVTLCVDHGLFTTRDSEAIIELLRAPCLGWRIVFIVRTYEMLQIWYRLSERLTWRCGTITMCSSCSPTIGQWRCWMMDWTRRRAANARVWCVFEACAYVAPELVYVDERVAHSRVAYIGEGTVAGAWSSRCIERLQSSLTSDWSERSAQR